FELGVSGELTESWQVHASYTHLDSEIVDDGPIDTNEGNAFPNTPKQSANLWTTFQVSDDLSVGAGATYVDLRYGDPENTVWVPSYVAWDAMAAYSVTEHWRLQLNVQN